MIIITECDDTKEIIFCSIGSEQISSPSSARCVSMSCMARTSNTAANRPALTSFDRIWQVLSASRRSPGIHIWPERLPRSWLWRYPVPAIRCTALCHSLSDRVCSQVTLTRQTGSQRLSLIHKNCRTALPSGSQTSAICYAMQAPSAHSHCSGAASLSAEQAAAGGQPDSGQR